MMPISNVKLAVGIPLSFPFVFASFLDSFVMAMTTAVGHGINIEFIRQGNGPLEALRNNIVGIAMSKNCTHLIQCDADMEYPLDTFPKLLNQCTPERPVVGALCFRRYPPFTPVLLRGELGTYLQVEEWEPGSLVEVDATGTGCLMFHMDVFRKIPEPWFEFTELNGKIVGEDIGFCAKVRKTGYPIHVDTSLEIGHTSIMTITEGTYRLYQGLKRLRGGAQTGNE